MAAAIILVPEMLSGPPQQKRAEPARAEGETPVKTYTIDLSRSPNSQVPGDDVPDTRAPPAETLPTPAAEPTDESSAEASQANPDSTSRTTAEQVAASPVPPPAPSKPEARKEPASQPQPVAPSARPEPTVRTPVASSAPAPRSTSGWAVQLGSFSSRATAERLTGELRAEGYEAFVMPVESGGATLYRVRVGPMPSRDSAEATLRKVKDKVRGAAVVTHP